MEDKLAFLESISDTSALTHESPVSFVDPITENYLLEAFPLQQEVPSCHSCGSIEGEFIYKKGIYSKPECIACYSREHPKQSRRGLRNKKTADRVTETRIGGETDVKKVNSKLRNRISAQQSRDRKKQMLNDLETQNQDLKLQNKALQQKLKEVESKNTVLMKKSRFQSFRGSFGLGKKVTMAMILSLLVFANSVDPTSACMKRLNEIVDLSHFKNPEGKTLQEATKVALEGLQFDEFNMNVEVKRAFQDMFEIKGNVIPKELVWIESILRSENVDTAVNQL